MVSFIISLGIINKKMLFPLIYIVVDIIYFFSNFYIKYNEVSIFISGLGASKGKLLVFFLSKIFKYRRTLSKKKKVPIKQYIKDYLILIFINAFFIFRRLIPYYVIRNNNGSNIFEYKELFIDSLQIIFLTLFTHFFLKYKYYIHHIISLIAYAIISVIIDLVLKNFANADIGSVINSISYVIVISIMYTYFKYLMEKKYYYYMDILFIMGIFDCILYILSFGIILLVQHIKGTNKLIFQFYDYYNEFGSGKMILIYLFGLIPRGLLLFFLEMKIIDMFEPSFVYLSYVIGKIPPTIILIKGNNRWVVLALSLFQVLFILFYLEILEYNFCSLNKNTKKHISERERKQSIEESNDIDNEIDIKGYDISDTLKTQDKIKDLNEMNEITDENDEIGD